jgi:hypothetical protein
MQQCVSEKRSRRMDDSQTGQGDGPGQGSMGDSNTKAQVVRQGTRAIGPDKNEEEREKERKKGKQGNGCVLRRYTPPAGNAVCL